LPKLKGEGRISKKDTGSKNRPEKRIKFGQIFVPGREVEITEVGVCIY
jgi:hypothetical protein